MSIVEILIPTRDVYNPLPSTWVVTDFDHGGSILGIDCLNKSRLLDGDPRLLISRASANGSTDSLIYSADTRDRSMVQCASIGEVTTEQNQDNSNEIGGHFGDLTEDRIIEDWITENREEVSQESDDIEDEIIEDEIVDNRGVGDDSDGIEDRIIEDGFIEDRVIEDMIAEHRADVINEDREEAINTSKDITDRIGEDREEVINENNVPADGIIENREQSDHESENENDPLEPPFSALENRGGQADSPLRRHSSHILIIQWLEARRRRGLPELEL